MCNNFTIKTLTVNYGNVRLDKYIRKIFPDLKQSIIEKYLRKGLITVNNQKVKSSYRVSCRDTIVVKYIDNINSEYKKPELKPNTKLIKILRENILYEDEYIVAINKPAGVVVQGGKNSISDVLNYVRSGEMLRIVHRIDRDTSGVVIFARNAMVAKYLMEEFKTRKVDKTYLALVVGIPDKDSGIIDYPLVKKYIAGQEKVVVDINSLHNAVTYFYVLDKLRDGVAYLKLKPITGRTHQLRVHLAHINCPILGDGKYGGRRAFISGTINKMHLHAHSLSLRLVDDREITITAPISKHIEQSIEMLSPSHVIQSL
jgi:23S rRNA pseudouridine955/2504/2580 synthase